MTLLIFFLKKIFYNKNKNKERFFSNKITRFFFTNTLYTCPNTHAKLTAASCLGDGVGPIFTLQSRRGQRPVVRKRRGNQRRNRSGRCGGGGGRRTEMASKAARTPPAVPSAGSTRRRAPPARLPLRPSTGRRGRGKRLVIRGLSSWNWMQDYSSISIAQKSLIEEIPTLLCPTFLTEFSHQSQKAACLMYISAG
ncbi:uncharacterized protein LOC122046673 isoform X4 [Zingiber officinale]|uniref:uncharacterized protein LOC122046673 isoform X4 n=1 Tax=Zingiber officinale TaxID=94328 RepID=UPI001C4C7855|nr:uncharacterized protein LOC122046673 isoform X4 [Zingiber officinale]